jgi:hypothetical protein
MFEEVKSFIETNILHSSLWDMADVSKQTKAVNNAERNLRNYYGESKEIPSEAIAYQTLWLLMIDDSIQRAGQGVSSVSVAGMSISLLHIDRSIAPEVLRMLGRRIGRYGLPIEDTFRHRTNDNYAKRGY